MELSFGCTCRIFTHPNVLEPHFSLPVRQVSIRMAPWNEQATDNIYVISGLAKVVLWCRCRHYADFTLLRYWFEAEQVADNALDGLNVFVAQKFGRQMWSHSFTVSGLQSINFSIAFYEGNWKYSIFLTKAMFDECANKLLVRVVDLEGVWYLVLILPAPFCMVRFLKHGKYGCADVAERWKAIRRLPNSKANSNNCTERIPR